jgi:hypothetical protein
MPRSKRAKVVHLSKVEKKGKELTLKTFANIQKCVHEYPYIYVFSVENMRNTYLKDVRVQLSDSRYAPLPVRPPPLPHRIGIVISSASRNASLTLRAPAYSSAKPR